MRNWRRRLLPLQSRGKHTGSSSLCSEMATPAAADRPLIKMSHQPISEDLLLTSSREEEPVFTLRRFRVITGFDRLRLVRLQSHLVCAIATLTVWAHTAPSLRKAVVSRRPKSRRRSRTSCRTPSWCCASRLGSWWYAAPAADRTSQRTTISKSRPRLQSRRLAWRLSELEP